MVNFTVDEIRGMMSKSDNIRCLSVIAHVDHGKSTLTDSLIGAAGIIAEKKAGDTRFMDTREDEQDRTITIKSTGVSLFFSMPKKGFVTRQKEIKKVNLKEQTKKKDREGEEYKTKMAAIKEWEPAECQAAFTEKKTGEDKVPFLINLIDSPGHVDFSSEVTAALRVTDGALVVVDCIEGVCVQTETVLRQAIAERIRPVLWVNKLDRIFLELHMPAEEAYQSFSRAIESANVIIANYQDDLLGEISVSPEKGTVGFGSGLHGWGFTTHTFSHLYSKKLSMSRVETMHKLWGENYMSKKDKFFKKQFNSKTGKARKRAFCKLIMEPIGELMDAVMNDKKEVYDKILENIEITIPKDARDLTRKPLLKRIMQTWLPAAQALLGMIAHFLPSPAKAQKYRVSNLYSGPLDDEAARAISTCNPKGPLMMYISKMIPTNEKGRFYAFGRVFSGTVATGMEVRIQGPDYTPGRKTDLHIKKIQRTILMMGRYVEQLPDVPCGNTCGLVGVDQYLTKSGTITTYDKAHNFVDMKYSVSPVVKVSVDVKNAADLPKLMEGLKRLSKSDPLVQCYTAKTGEHIIAGCGELHLQICLKDLAEQYMKGAPIVEGQPVVSFCETITKETPKDIVGKSANKHNRLYITARNMSKVLVDLIDEGMITQNQDFKKRARIIVDETKGELDLQSARKIWSFGIEDAKNNLLIDMTKGVAYLNEIKDSTKTAFQQAMCAGVLCGEAIRGMMVEVNDVVLHADAIHRGAGQIMPPMKRAIFGCQIASGPRLMEPMFLCDITVPMDGLNGVYNTLSQRRGEVSEEVQRSGTPLTQIKAFLPVLESFGFTGLLRENTSGMAFPQMIFSHWQLMNGEMYAEDAKLKKLMPLEGSFAVEKALEVRKRKGLKLIMPLLEDYSDKV